MTAKDVIMKMNKEAEYNELTAGFQRNDTKFIGENKNFRIPTYKKKLLQKSSHSIVHIDILLQSFFEIELVRVIIQSGYNKAQYYITDANQCASNVAEVNVCCDYFIQRLNNDFYNDFMQILKDC